MGRLSDEQFAELTRCIGYIECNICIKGLKKLPKNENFLNLIQVLKDNSPDDLEMLRALYKERLNKLKKVVD